MLRFIALFFAAFYTTILAAQADHKTTLSSKIAYATFSAQNIQSIVLDMDQENVEIYSTKGSRILIETKVEMDVDNPQLIEFIINSGRYNFTQNTDQNQQTLTLTAPENNNALVVKGKDVVEHIHYTIFIPEKIQNATVGQPELAMSDLPSQN